VAIEAVSYDLTPPESVGVDPTRLRLFLDRARLEVDQGELPSVQVAVARHGRLVAFETFGAATNQSRYILQSVGRNLIAGAMWKLLQEGMLRLSERIADIIPEFGTNGKDVVTLEQVLTHTAGFPFAPLGYPKMLDRAKRLEAMGKWRLDWEPGSRLQFHLTGAAWVLAELVERRTGLPFPEYLRSEILGPLGLDFTLPLLKEDYHRVLAEPTETDRKSPDDEIDPWGPWYLANPDVLSAGEPSHSIVGTAADVAQLGQAMLHSGMWSKDTLDDAIRPRVSMAPYGEQVYGGSDELFHVALFMVVGGPSADRMCIPHTGSLRTFGHRGAPCQLGFTDPDNGTSFAYLTNGYPLKGYDYSPAGVNRVVNLLNLGNDLVK
jgi:CubicO group peptidase (beta-lactamase class C family)